MQEDEHVHRLLAEIETLRAQARQFAHQRALWYSGSAADRDARRNDLKAASDGSFLLCPEEEEGEFALHYHEQGRILKRSVRQRRNGRVSIEGGDQDFSSVSDLIEALQKTPLFGIPKLEENISPHHSKPSQTGGKRRAIQPAVASTKASQEETWKKETNNEWEDIRS